MTRLLVCALALNLPAFGQVFSGGTYTLDMAAVDSAGTGEAAGGAYDLRGAAGQTVLAGPVGAGVVELRTGLWDPPRFSLQGALANAASHPSGRLSLRLPAGAVERPNFDALFNDSPLTSPLRVDPAVIRQADAKLGAGGGPEHRPVAVWEVELLDEGGLFGGALAAPGALSFSYRDADGDGVVDGTQVRAKTLALWLLDEERALWVKAPGAQVEPGAHLLSAPMRHLSVYAVIGAADSSVADVYAFPVPWRPFGPDAGTGPGKSGTEAAGISFTNLPSQGEVQVYTLDGRLVRRLGIPPNLAPARLSWDVRNEDGEAVASGVYIWRVASGANAKTGRLMVIR